MPFIIALIAGVILPKRFFWWSTLVFAIAYFVAAWLILDGRFFAATWLAVGGKLSPLGSPQKLVILGACAVIVGLIAQRLFSTKTRQHTLIILAIAAVGWLIWPKLIHVDIWQQVILASSTGIYALWLTFAFHQMRDEDIATSVSATILAIATGLCALIGASPLLGELAIAVGASAAAITFYGLAKRVDHGAGFYFPVVVLCSLIGIASVLYAKVPWQALIALASIPLIAMLFEWRYQFSIMRIIKLGMLILIPASIAVFLTRQTAGLMPI